MSSKIHTYSGLMVDPLDLQVDNVRIGDIIHHLSNQCRFSGATQERSFFGRLFGRSHYSVGQHSVLVSRIVPEEFKYDALMHDAAEYVLQDMARPLKLEPAFGQRYRGAESRAEKVIGEALGVTFPMPNEVKEADNILLVTEARDLMHGTSEWGNYQDIEPLPWHIKVWTPRRTRREFWKRYGEVKP